MASNSEYRKIRVLVAKVDLEDDDIESKIVARVLSNAGMEVIYTGLRQAPSLLVNTAIQEDVDVIEISLLSSDQLHYFPETLKILKESGMEDIALIGSGNLSAEDVAELKKIGVADLFPTGRSLKKMIESIQEIYNKKHAS